MPNLPESKKPKDQQDPKKNQAKKDVGDTSDVALTEALAELAELIKPLATDTQLQIAIYHLLLLWASFHVYQLEPEVTGGGGAKILPLDNGWKIFDYGDCLSTSPGEAYSSYCTGKLIEAAQKMIGILYERGATKVGFLGHEIAKRAAWMECFAHHIEIINFDPTDVDWEIRHRILEARAQASKRRAQVPYTAQRPE